MSVATSSHHRPLRGIAVVMASLLLITMLTAVTTAPSSAATDPCGSAGNKISCENSKPGSPPSEWDIDGAGTEDIQGFSTDISVNVGSRIDFKIDTDAAAYSVAIYRTGYYGGDGARRIATVAPSASLPQSQPECISDVATEMYDCGNWRVSASWSVPATAVSGVYVARLTRPDTGGASHITFVVRDDSSRSAIVAQTSDPTWQAYNAYGGSDFYRGADNGRAYKVSYNRPVATRAGIEARDFYFGAEYPLVRFMEKNGYDVSYIAGVDTDRAGPLLKNHRTFVSMGHDEYWSKAQRANVEAARDAGVNLAFLSGNEVYWKTRYEASSDADHTARRTLVSYKETWSNAKIDPSPEWTGTWRDPRFAAKAMGGGMPENGLTGTQYTSNHTDLPVTVSASEGKLRLWRSSGLQTLAAGTTVALAPHTVGYESNEDVDNGSRPAGLIRLSTTTGATPQRLLDFGNVVEPGNTTHHLTMYRASSGALVFSAGSIQWTWGLDATHDGDGAAADRRMQQAQVNLFADMGAQPTTLDVALTAAAASTDKTRPTAVITQPASGAAIANGTAVTAKGTASDVGGVVAGVEVSTDEGATWRAADGTTSWSYTYVQHGGPGAGATTIRARAVDDSANIGAVASRPLTIACACSVFGVETPAIAAADDADPVELGLRFSPTIDGFISGARFYKGTGNTGLHTASLWTADGQRLATVAFSGESASGWQRATFSSAVPVTKDTPYVISYTAPHGHYAVQANAFASTGVDARPLTVAGGFGSTPAGVYGQVGQFPQLSYQNGNYYVDPTFTTTDASPLSITTTWPIAGSTSVPTGAKITATYSGAVTAGSATLTLKEAGGTVVAGTTAYDATRRTVTFTPSAPLRSLVGHTATVGGTDARGQVVTTGRTWSFTTAESARAPGVCPCGLFADTTVPSVVQASDPAPVTVGVRFASDTAGTITGIRFYKGPDNAGPHTGALWDAAGNQLASGTFAGESSTGWQTLVFSQPVAIAKDTEYIGSYRAPVGTYSVTPDVLGSAVAGSPLRTPGNGGSYTYGSGFPDARSASSYLVDVVFERAVARVAVVARTPAVNAVGVSRSADVTAWFDDTVRPGATIVVKQGTSTIGGTTKLGADARSLTFTPSTSLPGNALIDVTLAGVTSTGGASLATTTWAFRTAPDDALVTQSLFGGQIPQTSSAADPSAVEVGTAFTPAKDGRITGIRFYKGAGNTGTHVGHIWASTGQQLATVTFGDETPTGWQSAALTQPLTVVAGATYVVSYLAPQGHYAHTGGFFATPLVNGDLTAPAGANGRYVYGAAGGFPTGTYGSTSYFVDVTFQAGP